MNIQVKRPEVCRLAIFVAGFSLLELMVVVLILAALAGAVISAAADMRGNAETQTALAEMQKIKTAILQYKQDVGLVPPVANPADFSALYVQPVGVPSWEISIARGWRGPYLSRLGEGLVDIGDDLQSDGTGSPVMVSTFTPTSSAILNLVSVADPFLTYPVRNRPPILGGGGVEISPAINDNLYTLCDDDDTDSHCLLDFRSVPGDPRHSRWGRPYLLFDIDNPARARILSMGPDGRYAGVNGVDVCQPVPGTDDLVVCLQG